MTYAFSPLEGDNDVLLLNKDTFTVSRFKELVEQAIKTKLNKTLSNNGSLQFTRDSCILTISGEIHLLLNDIQWRNSPIDCQLLKVGSQGWQKGKLRTQVNTKILVGSSSNEIDICIEFCPDEPTEPESPLDDLRQLPEYKQQS